MLKGIVSCPKIPKFFLIEDESAARGEDLFKAILKSDLHNNLVTGIHLICYENPPGYYLDQAKSTNIVKYDYYHDPIGWISADSSYCSSIINKLHRTGNLSSSNVMIDSLNMFFNCSEDSYNALHFLKQTFNKVTCLLHGDLVQDEVNRKIKFFSDISLDICTEESENSVHEEERKMNRTVDIVHKKSNGKMVAQKEIFIIDSNYNISSELLYSEKINKENDSARDNLESMTTFRLGLKMMENEKIARSNLTLPYMRTENIQSEGQIMYNVEEYDDLEEDPDEDLYI